MWQWLVDREWASQQSWAIVVGHINGRVFGSGRSTPFLLINVHVVTGYTYPESFHTSVCKMLVINKNL
jgi:hypothetical protein